MCEQAESGNQILFGGLDGITDPDKLKETQNKVSNEAFADVFDAQDEGKLRWEHADADMINLTTTALVRDGRGEHVNIRVFLFIDHTRDTNDDREAWCLTLGSIKDAPIRTMEDPGVIHLCTQANEQLRLETI